MKAKKPNKKFNLEKFEIAKLNNPKAIVGGDDTFSSQMCDTDTGGVVLSTVGCIGQKGKNPTFGIEP